MRLIPSALLVLLVSVYTASGADSLTVKEAAAAQKTYVAKCAKCHRFYEPKQYSEAAWERWMDTMSRKAKLKTEQEKLLTKYLDAYRAGEIQLDNK